MKYTRLISTLLLLLTVHAFSEYNLDEIEAEYISGWDFGSPLDEIDSITIIRPKLRSIAVKHDNAVKAYFIRYFGGKALQCASGTTIPLYGSEYSFAPNNLDAVYFLVYKDETTTAGLGVDVSPGSHDQTGIMSKVDTHFEPGEWVELDVPCELDEYPDSTFFVGAILDNGPHWSAEDSQTRGVAIPRFIAKIPEGTLSTLWEEEQFSFNKLHFPYELDDYDSSEILQITNVTANGSLQCQGTDVVDNGYCMIDDLTYQPKGDFFGKDQFEYIVIDTLGKNSKISALKLEIQPVNDAPTVPDYASITIDQGARKSINIAEWAEVHEAFSAGPENESFQGFGSLEIISVDSLLFDELPMVNGEWLNFTIRRGVLSQKTNISLRFHDDGGVAHGGKDSDQFDMPISIINTNTTQIRIDSVDTEGVSEVVFKETALDTIYLNTNSATIHFNYRDDADTLIVVENITHDTTVQISAIASGDQYPGYAEVVFIFNDQAPTISFEVQGSSDTIAPFNKGSKWILDGDTKQGTYIEQDGSVSILWTNDQNLELNTFVTKINKQKKEEQISGVIPVVNNGPLAQGKNTICMSEDDIFGNTTEECVVVYYDTTKPIVEILSPVSDSLQGSYAEVAYSGTFNLYDDDVAETFIITEPEPRVFEGEGSHTVLVSYMDAYGNERSQGKIVEIYIIRGEIAAKMDQPVQAIDGDTWIQSNPDNLIDRIYLLNTETGALEDKGGEGEPVDGKNVPMPTTEYPYEPVGFVLNIDLTLPELKVMPDGGLNWDHLITVTYFVYDLVGQYVAHYSKTIRVDKPQYLDVDGNILIKDQILPQGGYMVDALGRQLATGVYLVIGKVRAESTPNSNYYANITPRRIEKSINLRQGYVRD